MEYTTTNKEGAVDGALAQLDTPDLLDGHDRGDAQELMLGAGNAEETVQSAFGLSDSWLDGLDWALSIPQGDVPPTAIIDEIDDLRGKAKRHQAMVGRTHQGLIQILADTYTLAHHHRHDMSPVLLALRAYNIRITAATTANPMLPIIRLAMPNIDRRAQSYCARALCHLAAEGVDPG
ncbi:protein of unknown function [Magnetospirillum sp. XM-1]|uniref:hypothetical protein n=1 Tax=Magnetospirillum sp. XM-1 TaxID=1663591 RepID=UPI00073DFB1A|nr:hypothetical protein [Magnetospirillum sp. XM-1]CUW39329.1 protein of unknown function [Magnetospirillum sp. XM-1]